MSIVTAQVPCGTDLFRALVEGTLEFGDLPGQLSVLLVQPPSLRYVCRYAKVANLGTHRHRRMRSVIVGVEDPQVGLDLMIPDKGGQSAVEGVLLLH